MSAVTINASLITHMPSHYARPRMGITLLASMMVITGLLIATLEIRWALQLVSLSCVYGGALLAGLALVVHLLRRNLAWLADGGILAGLAALLVSSPVLPATLQDYLEYLMP